MSKSLLLIVFLVLSSLLLFGCIEENPPQSPPFTESQFVNKVTDGNYTIYKLGAYDGLCLVMDFNKVSFEPCPQLVFDANLTGHAGEVSFVNADGNALTVSEDFIYNANTKVLDSNGYFTFDDSGTYDFLSLFGVPAFNGVHVSTTDISGGMGFVLANEVRQTDLFAGTAGGLGFGNLIYGDNQFYGPSQAYGIYGFTNLLEGAYVSSPSAGNFSSYVLQGSYADSLSVLHVDSTIDNTSTATIVNLIEAYGGVQAGGTVDTMTGLYIGDIDGATNNYSIYTGLGQVYFGDKLGIGDNKTTPVYSIDVGGNDTNDIINSDNGYRFNSVTKPNDTSLTLTERNGGNMLGGKKYYYVVTYYTSIGETEISNATGSKNITLAIDKNSITINNIPVSTDTRVIGRKIYRTTGDGSQYSLYLAATITDNTTTSYIDTLADSGLGTTTAYFKDNTTTYQLMDGSIKILNAGINNTNFGYLSGPTNATGGRNTYLGKYTMAHANNSAGTDNVAVGNSAGYIGAYTNTTAVGSYAYGAIQGNQTQSTGVGYGALFGSFGVARTTNYSTAVGSYAGYNGLGQYGTVVGMEAGRNMYTANSYNTFMGAYAGKGNATGAPQSGAVNTGIGAYALNNLTSGSYNTALGYSAGFPLYSGSYNIFLGNRAGRYSTTESGELFINSYDRTDRAGEIANSIIYGTQTSNGVGQNLYFNADVHLMADSRKQFFGTSNDASVYYDGTNLVVNPKEVGVGVVVLPDASHLNINSAGNDKKIDIYHNDTSGYFVSNGGSIFQTSGWSNPSVYLGTDSLIPLKMRAFNNESYSGLHILDYLGNVKAHFGYAGTTYDELAGHAYFGAISDIDMDFSVADFVRMKLFNGTGNLLLGSGNWDYGTFEFINPIDQNYKLQIQHRDGNMIKLIYGEGEIEPAGDKDVSNLDYNTNATINLTSDGNLIINSTGEKIEFVNNVEFDGNILYNDTFWDDVVSPIIDVATTSQAPTWDSTYMTYLFHDDILVSQDYVFVEVQIPHKYKEDTNLYCHAHWMPSSTNTGDLNMGLYYTWTNIGDTQSSTPTYISAINAGGGTAYTQQMLAFPVINGLGKDVSSIFKAKLIRESASASDTFTGDALISFFDCHYEIDSPGSRERLAK